MKLEYEINKDNYLGISSSSLLRIIQNNNTPILDLLTREIIQNSIDASIEGKNNVEISLYTGKFDTYALNSNFGEIGTELYYTYKNEIDENKINSFIAFSDKNTTGLTGPINKIDRKRRNEKNGKFMNLVFNIGKAQSVEGSGGSFGYGKTVYYRTGIGLVIFYTRIFEDNKYKSRLIMAFVEDERDGKIINKVDSENENTGVMWFGKKIDGYIEPLTDESEIAEILSIFRIPLYEDEETGTTVIIPYINEEKLLSKTYYNNKNDNYNKPYWCDSIEQYLKVSIQRWYAPRLMNPYFKTGPYIKLFVNRNLFQSNDFLTTFKIIQELYNYPNKNPLFNINLEIKEEKINLRDSFEENGYAGSIYYTKVNQDDLDEKDDLYKQISNNKEFVNGVNPPIITFCRKPGMLLRYDTGDSWASKISSVDNAYIIGLFVANSSKDLIVKESDERKIVFEEYLRESEKADHESWQDLPNHNIIKKIQTNIQNKINNTYTKKEDEAIIVGSGTALSRKLTSLLLPAIGYGKKANLRKKKNGDKQPLDVYVAPKSTSKIDFIPKSIRKNNIQKVITEDFIIEVAPKDKKISYEICVEGEDNNITLKKWKEETNGKEFPLELIKIEILELKYKTDRRYPIRSSLNSINDIWKDDSLELQKNYEEGQWNGWNIVIEDENIVQVNCRLTYKYLNNKYLCSIVRQKENTNE